MKKFILMLMYIFAIIGLCGCNKQLVDLNYNFNYAVVELPNGEIVEGPVTSWTDYEDGDQIQVKIDGATYLVHSSDIALIHR